MSGQKEWNAFKLYSHLIKMLHYKTTCSTASDGSLHPRRYNIWTLDRCRLGLCRRGSESASSVPGRRRTWTAVNNWTSACGGSNGPSVRGSKSLRARYSRISMCQASLSRATYLSLTLTLDSSGPSGSPSSLPESRPLLQQPPVRLKVSLTAWQCWCFKFKLEHWRSSNLNFEGCWSVQFQSFTHLHMFHVNTWCYMIYIKLHLITWVTSRSIPLLVITSVRKTNNYMQLHNLHHLTSNYMHYICYM